MPWDEVLRAVAAGQELADEAAGSAANVLATLFGSGDA